MDPKDTPLAQMRKLYKKKDREIVAQHHGVDPDHPALTVLLSFCVKYDLDPLGGHVWLVDNDFDRAAAKDGEPVQKGDDLDVAVTRDGFLTIARRDPSYGGMEHDVVRTRDEFTTKRAGGEVEIIHNYPDLRDPDADGDEKVDPDEYRGDIIGSYCKVYVRDRIPTYYFAWMKEHGQFKLDDGGNRIFEGSWTYTSALIIKSAQSVALRLATGITGVVGIDEIRPDQRSAPAKKQPAPESPDAFLGALEIPDDLKAELREKVAIANEEAPNSWSLNKLRMRISPNADSTTAAARVVEDEVTREIDARAERAEPEDDVPDGGKEPVGAASVPGEKS